MSRYLLGMRASFFKSLFTGVGGEGALKKEQRRRRRRKEKWQRGRDQGKKGRRAQESEARRHTQAREERLQQQ